MRHLMVDVSYGGHFLVPLCLPASLQATHRWQLSEVRGNTQRGNPDTHTKQSCYIRVAHTRLRTLVQAAAHPQKPARPKYAHTRNLLTAHKRLCSHAVKHKHRISTILHDPECEQSKEDHRTVSRTLICTLCHHTRIPRISGTSLHVCTRSIALRCGVLLATPVTLPVRQTEYEAHKEARIISSLCARSNTSARQDCE